MILKDYQQKVLEDLEKFLELFKINQSASRAYEKLWKDHGNIEIGRVKSTNEKFLLPPYQDFFDGKPSVCLKVPTGGGKTFIACNSLKIIFDELSINKNRVVVWLVPSETILNQTLKALNDPTHPYRKQINEDFFSDVAIYTKEQLLNGQNFTPSIVEDQLSIMVLSYDSFRGRSNDFLRSKQSNANLSAFNVGKIENPIEGVDNDSLIQTINRLKPVIIVDESHHAKSPLSIKMLKNFNPRFVLELTATPHKDSNLISFVTASTLKDSNMVKLPVIIFKTSSVERVIEDAIYYRNQLEKLAIEERQRGGRYIRPIVLFQAQPKNSEEQITFKNLRERLEKNFSIPTDQIAVRTAEIDELKNKNLLSEECPIRYIITINALHEGWDCPFAYILA
ncbi:MAG: DEAD/DEAH box helicase family protein, partial [Selenomonadaceae bacterium]|nr:DEAD/DEAH box helicase family protein [Selenomonadaceae bacterium]